MAKRKGTHWVVTAAFTDDGQPVYLDTNGGWTLRLAQARAVDSKEALAPLMQSALAQERIVCDPYPFEVTLENGTPLPLSAREVVRRDGPTTRIRRPD